jgi:hypothetical protein
MVLAVLNDLPQQTQQEQIDKVADRPG